MLYNASEYNEPTSFLVENCKIIVTHMYEILEKVRKGRVQFELPNFGSQKESDGKDDKDDKEKSVEEEGE